MAVTVTNTTLATQNALGVVSKSAATSAVVNEVEVFTLAPTKADQKVVILIEVGATHGDVAFSIAPGDFWAASAAKTGSVAQATTGVIVLESAKYKKNDGKIAITFTPAGGKRLLTDHALKVSVIQLP